MTTPDHSAIPPVSTQVSETEALSQRIRERGACIWTNPEYSADYWNAECGERHIAADGHPINDQRWTWCAYCGGKLIVK